MLRLAPSVLKDLAIELQGLGVVTRRASEELRKAHIGAAAGDVPVEDLLIAPLPQWSICAKPLAR